MNQRIDELQNQLDITIQSLPQSAQRRYLSEESASDKLIMENQSTIRKLASIAGSNDVLFFEVHKNIGNYKIHYGTIPASHLAQDTPEMRDYIGGYRDNIESLQIKASECNAVVLFIRFVYSKDFVDYCGTGADALPLSKVRIISQS
jgi:hypothetical protein